jgi:hypothetical protein
VLVPQHALVDPFGELSDFNFGHRWVRLSQVPPAGGATILRPPVTR